MSEKRGLSKGKKSQKEEDRRALDSGNSKNKVQPVEAHEYECSGDFVEDFRQIVRLVGIAPEEAPKFVNKPNYSLWRNIELLPLFTSVQTAPRLSESPSFALFESNIKMNKEKGSRKEKSGKKKVSKTDHAPSKHSAKVSPNTDALSIRFDSNATEQSLGKKSGERLSTKSGRGQRDSSKAREDAVALDAIPIIEGTDTKPLQVVYEPFVQNRLKEVAVRGWTIDCPILEVLLKCWVVSDKLTTIILIDCGLKSSNLIQLGNVVPKIKNLEFLALDGNFVSEQNHGVVLGKASSLRSLSLRYANLDDQAMENLANAWRLVGRQWSPERPGLEFLDLSRNKITDRGLEYLIQALRFNRSLTTLALPGNRITDYGVKLLCNGIYNLKRRYRHGSDVVGNWEKGRLEKDDKKKDKDDSKKPPSVRLSGAQISAGNAVKPAGSAHPERRSPASSTALDKLAPSAAKSSSQKFSTSVISHSTINHNDPLNNTSSSNKDEHRASKRSAMHRSRTLESSLASQHGVKPAEPLDDENSLDSDTYRKQSDNPSSVDATTSERIKKGTRGGANEGQYSELTGSVEPRVEPRVAELLRELHKQNQDETALSDYDVWLDRAIQHWIVNQRNAEIGASRGIQQATFREVVKNHKGMYANMDMTASEYQLVLLQYCRNVVSGKADILGLPPQIQDDLLRLCQNPFFMFKEDEDEERRSLTEETALITAAAVAPSPLPETGPIFQMHVTAASLTDLNIHSVIPFAVVTESDKTVNVSPKTDISETVKMPETSFSVRLSTGGVGRRNAKSATLHRKVSLLREKKAKVKREIEETPKECAFFNVVSLEENFDALIDGVLYNENDRLISDGNRTLKVLNLMSNKITPKGVFDLMETVNKQREEQSTAVQWQRPASPDILMPKAPPAFSTSASDVPESDSTNVLKKELPLIITRQDERRTATKRSGLKRPLVDSDSVTATAKSDENSGDECSPLIVLARTVKDSEDPNRHNYGLLYVDVEHNKDLSPEDITVKVFSKFMKEQRESHGVGGKPSQERLSQQELLPKSLTESYAKETEEEQLINNLKKLPKVDPSQYTLLKSQYIVEKKAANQLS